VCRHGPGQRVGAYGVKWWRGGGESRRARGGLVVGCVGRGWLGVVLLLYGLIWGLACLLSLWLVRWWWWWLVYLVDIET
jgi:hypothetical protein